MLDPKGLAWSPPAARTETGSLSGIFPNAGAQIMHAWQQSCHWLACQLTGTTKSPSRCWCHSAGYHHAAAETERSAEHATQLRPLTRTNCHGSNVPGSLFILIANLPKGPSVNWVLKMSKNHDLAPKNGKNHDLAPKDVVKLCENHGLATKNAIKPCENHWIGKNVVNLCENHGAGPQKCDKTVRKPWIGYQKCDKTMGKRFVGHAVAMKHVSKRWDTHGLLKKMAWSQHFKTMWKWWKIVRNRVYIP